MPPLRTPARLLAPLAAALLAGAAAAVAVARRPSPLPIAPTPAEVVEPSAAASLSSPTPPASEAPDAPPGALRRPPAESASAAASQAPPAPGAPPALFALLFEQGRTWRYTYSYYVDPHSAEDPGPRTPDRGAVLCRAARVVRHDAGLFSQVRCDKPQGKAFADFRDDLPIAAVYGTDGRSLWVLRAMPANEASARKLLAAPPYLSGDPSPLSSRQKKKSDGFDYEASQSVAQKTIKTRFDGALEVWCRRDVETLFYGSTEERCFAPSAGLASRVMNGRSGPSEESLSLQSTAPPAP